MRKPIVLLLAVTLVIGLFVFRDYGLTWDEPLFYAYGDSLGYAYTPANWFSGQFDLARSYGPSADDHKNRGPAYLLLAREPVYLLQALGVERASAWHLLNFGCYLLGVYFVYRLAQRLVPPWPAAAAAALFAFQPMLWGHAFINPKDMPFLVFFTGAAWLGLRMVDRLINLPAGSGGWLKLRHTLLAALLLGLATANRVLGPLAGLLVLSYLLGQRRGWRSLGWMAAYAFIAALVALATWPYLWEGPGRFLDAFQFMSANPTGLAVLFGGEVYRAYELPRRYLPFFLATTLTEFVWPAAILGGALALSRFLRDRARQLQVLLLLAWFGIPALYVVALRPPIYDGMRHFLFILPPVFVLAGLAFDLIIRAVRRPAIRAAAIGVILLPGLLGIVRLHPYEYTYYNSFIGDTAGAFRRYETDYWLTCYREAVLEFNAKQTGPVNLYVHREAEAARPYAASNVTVLDERGARSQIGPGDFMLVNTRTNEDRQVFRDAPPVLSVGRAGATFCIIKGIP